VHALAGGQVATVLITQRSWEPARRLGVRPFVRLEIPEATYAERRAAWAQGLPHNVAILDERELNELAGRFRLTAGQVDDALLRAGTLARARHPVHSRVTAEARAQGTHIGGLMTLAPSDIKNLRAPVD
jgi:hypothetical protein